MADWDCIVVGAGIIGSWAGYHLAAGGKHTLILDQFMVPHTRGSSGGQSRIIRKAYNKACYAAMMEEAYAWWDKLEKDSGLHLFKKTGMLILQRVGEKGAVDETQEAMDQYNLPYTLLTPSDLAAKYPAIANTSQYTGLLDPDAGLLLPSRCLTVIQDEFKKKGGKIQDGEKVENIIPGTPVTVITSRRSYTARKVIVAAGPWSKDILAKTGIDLPIKTMPGLVCYFFSHVPHIHSDVQQLPIVVEHSYSPGGNYRLLYIIPITEYPQLVKTMPGLSVFFQEQTPSRPKYTSESGFPIIYVYLYYRPGEYRFVTAFPSLEYPGMVKLVTRGEPPAYYCHPDDRDTRGSQDLIDILTKYVKEHLPGLDPTPKIMEPCVYTMTGDRDYIIDRHPLCENIIIAAGFSGHGYMRAPIIGLVINEMIRGIQPSYDLGPFRMNRFQNASFKSNL